MTNIIYEDDTYRITILQEFRTLKKRSNIFTKNMHLYLGANFCSGYLSIVLNYDKSNNTIFTYFEYDDDLPKNLNNSRYQLKYNPLCVKRLYEHLFNDIKNKNYMREKIE